MCVCAHLFLSGWEQLSKTGVRSSPSRIRSSGGLMPARTRLVVNRSMTLANWKFTYRQEKKINGSSKIRCSTHTHTQKSMFVWGPSTEKHTTRVLSFDRLFTSFTGSEMSSLMTEVLEIKNELWQHANNAQSWQAFVPCVVVCTHAGKEMHFNSLHSNLCMQVYYYNSKMLLFLN